jgi:hypothetical protein
MIRQHLEAALAGQATGRRYTIDVTKLDEQEQRELFRLIRDLKEEVSSVKRQARTQPWRFVR